MTISEHADRTFKVAGIRAEDIHKWIDGLFDAESFDHFLRTGRSPDYDPYDHRKHRHCREALEEAYQEFGSKYTREQIRAVFECHVKDDYNGYLPHREDFENGTFTEKYHENGEHSRAETILSETELSEYFKGKVYPTNHKPNPKHAAMFRLRIVLPTILAMVLFVSSIFIIIVPVFRSNMMNRKKEMIKELTFAAASVVNYYVEQAENGNLPRDLARQKAAAEIEKMRYGSDGKDYFWITDMHPRMIMHPYRTELDNTDLTNYRDREDKSGKKLFVEFVQLVRENGEGYLEYLWQWKDDSTRTAPKLSYVTGIPKWDWIIGTGIYIHDVEEEINRLIRNLLLIFGLISLGITIILVNIVLQSRRIEHDRQRAETGLREAKDRYRALVEASNEGYILEVAGETIYSNHTLQRMLGFSEEELAKLKLWELLEPDSPVNEFGIRHFKELVSGQTKSAEFEAQIKAKSGEILDMVITTSRIFFSEKNGHVISFRKITHRQADSVLAAFRGSAVPDGNVFISRQVADVYRPLPQEITETPAQTSIPVNADLSEALKRLDTTAAEKLFVINPEGQIVGEIGYAEIARVATGLPGSLQTEIEQSQTVGHVVQTLNRMPLLIREMTTHGARPATLRTTIGKMFDAAIVRFIQLSIQESGDPPVPFAFLSLGSNARHEMTLFSDQDNALIFANVKESEMVRVKRYFLKLAESVCSKLNQAGYPYCPGGIMAMNPRWSLSLREWQQHFAKWILEATPESILEVNVFFDIHCTYGEERLVNELRAHVLELTRQNPEFFIHFARNGLLYKVPLNVLGKIRAETRDGVKAINIKESLKPLEIFARIYALKNNIIVPGTLDRLKQLYEKQVLREATFREMVYVFDYLWHLRFFNQIASHTELKRVNDELELATLTEIELGNLRNVLSSISDFQSKLSYDFFGSAL